VLATKACSIFDKATEPRTQARRLNRGARLLRRASVLIARAAKGGRIADGCAAALVERLNDTRNRAQRLAGVR